jgi:HEPN domain-containing protein
MNVSTEALDWIRKAESDLAAARWLTDSDQALPDQAGFFCQQAAEKYLKAFLIACDQVPPRTHDIDVLVELCAAVDPAFDQLQSQVEGLTEFAVIFRYPDAWSDEEAAFQSLDQVERVRSFVRLKLDLPTEDS